MTAGELEVVILIPVFQAQVREGRSVGELQIREVPIQYLTILGGEVHIAGKIEVSFLFVQVWGTMDFVEKKKSKVLLTSEEMLLALVVLLRSPFAVQQVDPIPSAEIKTCSFKVVRMIGEQLYTLHAL